VAAKTQGLFALIVRPNRPASHFNRWDMTDYEPGYETIRGM